MGIFSPPKQRQPYVPPMGGVDADNDNSASRSGTMLGGSPPTSNDWLSRLAPTGAAGLTADTGSDSAPAGKPDPNLVRVADPVAEAEIAQQSPPRAPAPQAPPLSAAEQAIIARPGRGSGVLPQNRVEARFASDAERRINRLRALQEIAGTSPPKGAIETPLPDDWERTKPSEIVDDLRRAAQRHVVPPDVLARMMYQEGKFNEPDKLARPLVWSATKRDQPLGWAQMTTQTLDELKRQARARGDVARARELEGYSLANREQAFDAAAEYLALGHRQFGSWPAAVASYNDSLPNVARWLAGDPTMIDPMGRAPKWKEISNYVSNAFRGSQTMLRQAQAYDQPGLKDESRFRVPPPVLRNPNLPDRWRIAQDPKENP